MDGPPWRMAFVDRQPVTEAGSDLRLTVGIAGVAIRQPPQAMRICGQYDGGRSNARNASRNRWMCSTSRQRRRSSRFTVKSRYRPAPIRDDSSTSRQRAGVIAKPPSPQTATPGQKATPHGWAQAHPTHPIPTPARAATRRPGLSPPYGFLLQTSVQPSQRGSLRLRFETSKPSGVGLKRSSLLGQFLERD